MTAHESGWSRTPSKCYGSPVCAFGAPQASGFGSRELIAPRDPGTGSPVRWHCPFVVAYSPDYWTPSPTPERLFKEWDRRGAHLSPDRHLPARHPGVHLHVALTGGEPPGPLGEMLLRARENDHPPKSLPGTGVLGSYEIQRNFCIILTRWARGPPPRITSLAGQITHSPW